MSEPHATSDLQAFAAGVDHTLAALQRLSETLQTEQQALSGNEPDALQHAVQDKLAALNALEPVLSARDAVQRRLGVEPGLTGGDRLVAGAPAGSAVRDSWAQVKTLAARIEQLNLQNGQLAHQGEKTTRQAVAILTGRSAEPQVYGRRGATDERLGTATLGKV